MILTILLVIIGVLIMVLAVYLVPKWQTKRIIDFKSKRWQAENEFRKTLIQVFGGLMVITSLLFTWWQMGKNQRNLEKGQHITRFSQAISFLGSNNADQKIGGIYTLEQIAKESPEEYLGTVIEVLSAFVRNAEVEEVVNEIKPETKIAVTVLGRIRTVDNKKLWKNLPGINLVNAKLMGADLRGANLMEANLMKANLMDADLIKADLKRANLMLANLRRAILWQANLMEAKLWQVNLMEADLMGAKNLEVGQLLKAITLFNIMGLPPEMEKMLKKMKPELFESPWK